jgi:tetratricopeptide (TPR) repeat protein
MTSKRMLFVMLVLCAPAYGQSFQKAEMLHENGLLAEAQRELIELVFSSSSSAAADKPKALNLLAGIAVDKNNLRAAVGAWTRLIRDYPKSPEAINAKARLPILSNVLGQVAEESVNDAAARVYLRSGDFWAKGKDGIFQIDSSWISNVEAAAFWYDRAIADFPQSPAARIAYEEKMRTLIGWKDPGQYGEAHGTRKDKSYVPILEATFREYEKAFPKAAAAQAFRYQIAQVNWKARDWQKTRDWLNEIIEKDKGAENSFYKDLAERRLKKVEF